MLVTCPRFAVGTFGSRKRLAEHLVEVGENGHECRIGKADTRALRRRYGVHIRVLVFDGNGKRAFSGRNRLFEHLFRSRLRESRAVFGEFAVAAEAENVVRRSVLLDYAAYAAYGADTRRVSLFKCFLYKRIKIL